MKKYVVLGGILLSLIFALPAWADETVTSSPPLDPEAVTPSTTPDSIPTSTLEIVTTTPDIILSSTTTPDIIPTTTPEISTTTDTTSTSTPTTTPIIDSGSSGNASQQNSFTTDQINQTANRIINYLQSQQSIDGKINDGSATDWAIMSFAVTNQYANDIQKDGVSLLKYEENYKLNDDPVNLNICATYPRHILAFLAAGIDKNNSAFTDLRNNILTTCYKDHLYGEPGINDDIFALFALIPTGSKIDDEIITDIINTIKTNQDSDGAFTYPWGAGADLTGATINALKYVQNNGAIIDQQILINAKQYLKTNQLADGGWGYGTGDVLTTSWVMMGINALGESQSDWTNSANKNPWNILIDNNKTDGSYESAWVPGTTDWFALQNAVPALLGKTWPIILEAKPQVFNYSGGSGCNNCQPIVEIIIPTSTPTTTIEITTSTTEITTTTLETIVVPTSTIVIAVDTSTTTTAPTQTISTIKKVLPKKIIKKTPRIIERNNVVTSTLPTNTPTEEIKKSNFAQVISSSKNSLIYLGHQLLKLLRNVL
ncbi:MAG: hypothetical protein Q7S24_00940 [bacterium]|nr:hypothetical protein [bacterium]